MEAFKLDLKVNDVILNVFLLVYKFVTLTLLDLVGFSN